MALCPYQYLPECSLAVISKLLQQSPVLLQPPRPPKHTWASHAPFLQKGWWGNWSRMGLSNVSFFQDPFTSNSLQSVPRNRLQHFPSANGAGGTCSWVGGEHPKTAELWLKQRKQTESQSWLLSTHRQRGNFRMWPPVPENSSLRAVTLSLLPDSFNLLYYYLYFLHARADFFFFFLNENHTTFASF